MSYILIFTCCWILGVAILLSMTIFESLVAAVCPVTGNTPLLGLVTLSPLSLLHNYNEALQILLTKPDHGSSSDRKIQFTTTGSFELSYISLKPSAIRNLTITSTLNRDLFLNTVQHFPGKGMECNVGRASLLNKSFIVRGCIY